MRKTDEEAEKIDVEKSNGRDMRGSSLKFSVVFNKFQSS
jgi:hypothetical protein